MVRISKDFPSRAGKGKGRETIKRKLHSSNNFPPKNIVPVMFVGSSRDIGSSLLKVSMQQKVIETQLRNFSR